LTAKTRVIAVAKSFRKLKIERDKGLRSQLAFDLSAQADGGSTPALWF